MIRPFTCLCMIAAGMSGLYLYQTKYQAQVLDRDIRQAVDATQAARERIAVLRTDWAMLNQPDRLQEQATRLLPNLKPTLPTQLVQMADLGAHLPPPIEPGAGTSGTDRDEDADLPVPPIAPDTTPTAAAAPPAPAIAMARPVAAAPAPVLASLPHPRTAEETPRPPVPEKHPPAVVAHAAAAPIAERRTPSLLAALTPSRAPIPLAPPAQPAHSQQRAQPANGQQAAQSAYVPHSYMPHSYMPPIGAPVVRTMAPMQGRPPVAPASDERWAEPRAGTSMVSSLGALRMQMAPPVPIGANP